MIIYRLLLSSKISFVHVESTNLLTLSYLVKERNWPFSRVVTDIYTVGDHERKNKDRIIRDIEIKKFFWSHISWSQTGTVIGMILITLKKNSCSFFSYLFRWICGLGVHRNIDEILGFKQVPIFWFDLNLLIL